VSLVVLGDSGVWPVAAYLAGDVATTLVYGEHIDILHTDAGARNATVPDRVNISA
jgi:hypothetical protein